MLINNKDYIVTLTNTEAVDMLHWKEILIVSMVIDPFHFLKMNINSPLNNAAICIKSCALKPHCPGLLVSDAHCTLTLYPVLCWMKIQRARHTSWHYGAYARFCERKLPWNG